MKNVFSYINRLSLLFVLFAVASCVNQDFDEPPSNSNTPDVEVNTTISQLREKHILGEYVKIEDDLTIGATVVADDESGNYYRTLIIEDGSAGIDILINANDLYNDYPVGRKIFINCKGLWLGDYNNLIQLGSEPYESNGNLRLGGIEEAQIPNFIVKGPRDQEVVPATISITDLTADAFDPYMSRLIKIENIQFADNSAGVTYATLLDPTSGTPSSENRDLQDCDGNTLVLRSSGYSSFVSELTPSGKGSITGIYSIFGTTKQLYIRDTDDVEMTGERCDGSGGGGTGGGVTGDLIDISTIRASFPGASTAPTGTKIKGIVISDRQNGNLNGQNLMLQDGSAGIVVRFSEPHSFNLNDELEIGVSGVELSEFNDLLQLNGLSLSNASKTGTGSVTPNTITVSELLANAEELESTLVKIDMATLSGGNTYGDGINLSDGSGTVILWTYNTASFATASVSGGTPSITGIASQYRDDQQLLLRNLDDVVGGTGGGLGSDDELEESFNGASDDQDISFAGWSNIAVKGTRVWRGKEFSGNLYAQATAYNDMEPDMETWMVTPAIEMTGSQTLNFESAQSFWVHDGLSVWISTNFDGNNISSANWEEIDCELASSGDDDYAWIPSGSIDLSGYSNKVHIAFKYVGSGSSNTTSYAIDNVVIK